MLFHSYAIEAFVLSGGRREISARYLEEQLSPNDAWDRASLITFNEPDALHFTNTEDNPGACYTTSPIAISTESGSFT